MKTFKQLLWFIIPILLLLIFGIYMAISYGGETAIVFLRVMWFRDRIWTGLVPLFSTDLGLSLIFGTVVLAIRFFVRKKDNLFTTYFFYPICTLLFAVLMGLQYADKLALSSGLFVLSMVQRILYPTILCNFVLLITWLIDKFIFRRLAKTKQLEN